MLNDFSRLTSPTGHPLSLRPIEFCGLYQVRIFNFGFAIPSYLVLAQTRRVKFQTTGVVGNKHGISRGYLLGFSSAVTIADVVRHVV